MRSLYTTVLLIAMAVCTSTAQRVYQLPIEDLKKTPHVLSGESFAPVAIPPQPSVTRAGGAPQMGTVIMNTTYDLGSNSTTPKRIYRRSDGTMGVTWTGSVDLGGGWPDRGSFYVYFDGTNWDAIPTTRIEGLRTGWPTIAVTASGKEVIIPHDFGAYELEMLDRTTAGTGTWNFSTPSMIGTWPRMASGIGETLHVINANYSGGTTDNSFILYSRSDDGGSSWAIKSILLPDQDTAHGYVRSGGDAYTLDVQDSIVAIVGGNSNNSLAIWKSTNNGASFTRTTVLTHPIPNMNGEQITDIDADSVADIIEVHDASHEVLIDTNGNVHVWSGMMGIFDDDPAPGSGWSYFPGWNGMWYWNEGMGTDSLEVLTGVLDLDGDTTINGVGRGAPGYGVSLSSMPTASLDPTTNNIYLVYSAAVEFTDYFDDPADAGSQSFRDLYGMYTTDGGATWSNPANLTRNSKVVDNLGNFEGWENVYPTTPRLADGKVHVVWQRDEEPGNALENSPDPIVDNDIVYHDFDYSDFDVSTPPGAIFSDSTPGYGGRYWFTDMSTNDPHHWIWSFGDGDTALSKNPFHKYSTDNSFTVCLRAVNFDGWSDTCTAIAVSGVGVNDQLENLTLEIYPNPSAGMYVVRSESSEQVRSIWITDLLGRTVWEGDPNRNTWQIDLSDVSNGTYLLNVNTSNRPYTTRMLKAGR